MNYHKHYWALIDRAKGRLLAGYTEKHHITPRCMGGSDELDNLVVLTAQEHYVAHQLLTKMHPDVRGLATAAVRMAKQCTGKEAYAWLRKRHAEAVRVRALGNKYSLGRTRPDAEKMQISSRMKGVKKSPETKIKMSEAQRGNQKAKGLVRGPMSEEHKRMAVASRVGVPLSEEHRKKISRVTKGRKKSPETIARMSAAQKARRKRSS